MEQKIRDSKELINYAPKGTLAADVDKARKERAQKEAIKNPPCQHCVRIEKENEKLRGAIQELTLTIYNYFDE